MKFFKDLYRLLKIALRKVIGRETISLTLLTALMFLRSNLTVTLSDVQGDIAKAIIRINIYEFIKNVL